MNSLFRTAHACRLLTGNKPRESERSREHLFLSFSSHPACVVVCMPALPQSDQTSNRTRLVRSFVDVLFLQKTSKVNETFCYSLACDDHLSPSWLQSIIIIRESRALGQRREKKSDDRRIGKRRGIYFACRTRRRRRAEGERGELFFFFLFSRLSTFTLHARPPFSSLFPLSDRRHTGEVKWTELTLNSIEPLRVLRFR